MNHITPKALSHQWLSENENHHMLLLMDPAYPRLLSEIANPPPMLFIDGDISVLSQAQIAIVGSRNPSHTGLEIAYEFAFQLAKAGLCITSGLATGIDTASHEGALAANGKTIGVLGSGLLEMYPKKNKLLAKNISENGCVISEFPLQARPTHNNFPRRNRIISGLSLGTLVIEAALKSGSLITARFATEQNREVFAIPGSIRNPVSQGCLSLIQQGAKCVISVNDILEEITTLNKNEQQHKKRQSDHLNQNGLDPASQQVLACIENDITSVDQICARSKLSPSLVSATLSGLELAGVVKTQYGGYIKV